jgi:hypothetical protein
MLVKLCTDPMQNDLIFSYFAEIQLIAQWLLKRALLTAPFAHKKFRLLEWGIPFRSSCSQITLVSAGLSCQARGLSHNWWIPEL